MALIPPTYLDCVTAIGFRGPKGVQYAATGVLFGRFRQIDPADQQRRQYAVYLVTNRHVFEGKSSAVLRFNPPPGQSAREYDLALIDARGGRIWEAHADPSIDAAAISINVQLLREHGIEFSYFQSLGLTLARNTSTQLAADT